MSAKAAKSKSNKCSEKVVAKKRQNVRQHSWRTKTIVRHSSWSLECRLVGGVALWQMSA